MRWDGIQYLRKGLRNGLNSLPIVIIGDIEYVGVYVDILADTKSMWKFFPELFWFFLLNKKYKRFRTRRRRSRWRWSTSLSTDTTGIHLQTQKYIQNTS